MQQRTPSLIVEPGSNLGEVRLVRTRPRFYLHRLAQYLESSPTGRRQLIEAAKYPSPFRLSYAPAARLFGEALRLGWDDELMTAVALQRWWVDSPPESDHAAVRRMQVMDAVDAFCPLLERINQHLLGLSARVRLADRLWLPLEIGGVKIADMPAVILERSSPDEVGVLAFHISKSRPHTDRSLAHASVLSWALARANQHKHRARLSPRLCMVVDVFSGQMMDADRGHRRRMRKTELACAEIAALWPEV